TLTFGSSTWIPKDGFTSDPRVIGIEGVGGTLGTSLADSEMAVLIQELQALPNAIGSTEASALNDFVSTVIDLLTKGYRASVALIPLEWPIMQALHLGTANSSAEAIPAEWDLPEDVRQAFVGRVQGVPVFRHHRVPSR